MTSIWRINALCALLIIGMPVSNVSATSQIKIPLPSEFHGMHKPWQLVRQLQLVQDAIAAGTNGTLQLYRKLLIKASGMMLAQPNDVWTRQNNLNAAAIYILIGGNPAVGVKALSHANEIRNTTAPLIAAIAYAQRDFSRAHKAMLAIDHTKLPLSAAAQFALVKSMVTSSTDLKKAIEFLDEARRLAPGTLIEEASLRRSLRIVGEQREFEKFKTNATIYFRRFPNSHYFGDYLKNYAYGLARMPIEYQDETLIYVRNFMAGLTTIQQLNVLIYISRSATISGRVKLAYWASNHALSKLENNPAIKMRLKLYSAASGLVQAQSFDASAKRFSNLKRDLLTANDQKLYDAVSALLQRLQSDPIDLEKMKSILRRNQQIFPDDDPQLPDSLENEARVVSENPTLLRSQKLLAQLSEQTEKVSQ